MSATAWRKDGLHCLLPGLFSPMMITPEKNNTIDPVIIQLPYHEFDLVSNDQTPWAMSETMLYQDQKYRDLCAFLLDATVALGYKPLLTANRVEFIQNLVDVTRSKLAPITSNESIDTREDNLNAIRNGSLDGLVGTLSILKEGVSCNDLSCLILTSSTNNKAVVAQVVGRIMRLADNKKNPVVIDITLPKSSLGQKHARERRKIYKDQGWDIIRADHINDARKSFG